MRKKIIATKDYNLSTKHFTTAITPKLHRDGHPSSTLGDELVERQGQLHACIYTGVSDGNVSSEKLKILYFWNWNHAHYGDISANLDQAMSKKKHKKTENTCKKNTHTHTHTHTVP